MKIRSSKLIAPLFIFLFILIIAFVFSTLSKKEEGPKAVVETPRDPIVLSTEYSRVSFFLGQPIRASLAIPEYWEGKYRMKQSPRQVSFYYIGAPGEEIKLFDVYLFDKDNWELGHDNSLVPIDSLGGWTVAYTISTDEFESVHNKAEYIEMNKDIKNIIASLKIK